METPFWAQKVGPLKAVRDLWEEMMICPAPI